MDRADPASRSRVVLMCGVAGAGMTTYARALEARGFVRLSIDEDVWTTFGRFGVDYTPDLYPHHSDVAEQTLRHRLIELIRAGADVVVDFSFWARAQRRQYTALIEEAGATWELTYLRVPRDELCRRLAGRASRFDADAAFPIDEAQLDRYLAAFEEPYGEGERVIDHVEPR